jgi:hypothetical protein
MAHPLALLVGLAALAAAPAAPPEGARPAYLFDIATAAGASDSTWAALAYDRAHDELFAVFGGQVHVFNGAGMESYTFGGDGDVGQVERVGLLESGELLLLSSMGGRRAILQADFRGERLGTFAVRGLPAGFEGFEPDRLQVQGERVYLVQTGRMRLVVTDLMGKVEQAHDLAALVRASDPGIKAGMSGFFADPQGNLYFTMPLAFAAFVMSPARELRRFGTRGSSPGRFNVVGAIAADEQGNVFVLDRLRSVVMMFDPSLRFLSEVGYRGDGPSNLVAPFDLAVGNGKVFASQARDRGVKVFHYQPPAAPGPARAAEAGGG